MDIDGVCIDKNVLGIKSMYGNIILANRQTEEKGKKSGLDNDDITKRKKTNPHSTTFT